MDFESGDYVVKMDAFKSALFDELSRMSKDDDTDGEDVVVTTKAFEKCIEILDKVGTRMA